MAGEDDKYRLWIKGLPCRKCYGRPCDPHHPTHLRHTGTKRKGPGSRKAHDHMAIPLCMYLTGCHRQLHDLSGPFKGWTRAQSEAWQDEQIVMVRAQYRPEHSSEPRIELDDVF